MSTTVESITVERPDPLALIAIANRKISLVQAIVIDSPMMYQEAGTELQKIVAKIDELEAKRKGLADPLYKVWKGINELFKPATDRLGEARDMLKQSMLTYQQEEARKQREAEQQRLEAARREQERLKAEAAARQTKADEEAAALRKKAEAAIAAGNNAAAARFESKADSRETAGAAIAAELQMSAAAVVYTPPVSITRPKAAGISTRTKWKAQVTNKAELIAYVAANPAFLNLLDVNETKLNQLAVATSGAAPIAGVRFFEDQILAARRA